MGKRWVPLFIFFVVSVGILQHSPLSAANLERSTKNVYNPSQVYTGSYEPDIVYYRPSQKTFWRRGLNDTFPANVSCPGALKSLSRSGLWKGHFRPDGSCGPTDEPSEWAVGNRLNFDESANPSAVTR